MFCVWYRHLAVTLIALACSLASLLPAHAETTTDIHLEEWQSYAPMAEQGAICGAFAGIMSMQSIVDDKRGTLWAERRNYAGSVVRKAAEFEGLTDIRETAIDKLLNRYSMWLLNHMSAPDDASLMDDGARQTATSMIRDVCTGLFEKADEAIIVKFPALAAVASSAGTLADNKSAFEAASRENDRITAQNTQLQTELDVTKADLAVAQTQLADLQSSLQMMQDDAADSVALAQEIADLQDKLLRMSKQQAEVESLQSEMAGLRQENKALMDERDRISAELDAAVLALLVPDSADDLASSKDAAEDNTLDDFTVPTGDMATLPATESMDALPVDEFALGSSESLDPPSPMQESVPSAASALADGAKAGSVETAPSMDEGGDLPLFIAQLGAFRKRVHAEAEISMLLDTFSDDLTVAELTVTPGKMPDGEDIFKVLTRGMPANAATKICEALWQRMVGCILKAAP